MTSTDTPRKAPHRPQVIVVGVDGSDSSVDALRWAVKQATQTGKQLRVVTAWAYPEHPAPFGIVPNVPLPPDPLAEARRQLDEVTGRAVEHTGVDVETAVLDGNAAPVLIEASKDADLLVVGSRGHGAFAGLLLGSVSEHCVHHAHCPVVVIRHPHAA